MHLTQTIQTLKVEYKSLRHGTNDQRNINRAGRQQTAKKRFLKSASIITIEYQPITTKHSGCKGNVYPMDVTIVRGLAK